MTKEAFEEYNKIADIPLKNLRNGAAGALRNLNVRETARRNLSAFFYDVGYNEGTPFKTYSEMLKFIEKQGIPMDDYVKDRKSTRLNSSHANISYAVFCLKKKINKA